MRVTRIRLSRRLNALAVVLATAAAAVVLGVPAADPVPTAEAAVRKHVDTDYTLLRRGPRSYVIGTAYRGWTADIHGPQQAGYRWARVYGDLNQCLWIYSGAVAGSTPHDPSCGDQSWMSVNEFTNGRIGGSDTDGATVATVAGEGCTTWDGLHIRGYGNVRPWDVPARATAPLNGQVALGQTVRWRYVSRDGNWVMIRDPRAGSTDGKGLQGWYFMPRSCLPAQLP